jgi:hypothetical protein
MCHYCGNLSKKSSTAQAILGYFAVTGGQVYDSQVVGDVLDTPKPLLAVTADKATTARRCASRSKMTAPCRSS